MTTFAPAGRCLCVRRIAEMSCPAWVTVHLVLYFTLDVVAMATLGYLDGLHQPVVTGFFSLFAVMPLHAFAGAIAVLLLLMLRPLGTLRWGWFRLAAVAAFTVPALPVGLLLVGEAGPVTVIVAWHALMGLLVVQPGADRAHDLPSMDSHRF